MRLPDHDGFAKIRIRNPWIELWCGGQLVWWTDNLIPGKTTAERIGEGIDYCKRWTGSLPEIIFEGKPKSV